MLKFVDKRVSICNVSVTVTLTQFGLKICHCCCGGCSSVWSLLVVFEREQMSNGFKRIPLDLCGSLFQLHFQK